MPISLNGLQIKLHSDEGMDTTCEPSPVRLRMFLPVHSSDYNGVHPVAAIGNRHVIDMNELSSLACAREVQQLAYDYDTAYLATTAVLWARTGLAANDAPSTSGLVLLICLFLFELHGDDIPCKDCGKMHERTFCRTHEWILGGESVVYHVN